MIRSDVIIIGAGLLGCFTARNLKRYEIDVIVLEKENDVCRGISKANTGIVYTGYDNSSGSEKQKLCIRADEAFDRLCSELEVPFARPGSLMISYGPAADSLIRKKYSNGLNAGIQGISLLSGSEAEAMEPLLARGITSALYSRRTGTVDPWELCIAAYENAKYNGAEFVFGSMVTDIRREAGGFAVSTPAETYHASAVVNAAGLLSDEVREMAERPFIRLFPTSADYIILDRAAGKTVDHIIFHEGEDGKGLTLVPTVDGNLLIGPTDREPSEEELLTRDMRTSSAGLESLRELCSLIAPEIDTDQQIRTFGSMRPNPFYVSAQSAGSGRSMKSIKDIRIIEENGLISLIGIKTPGLTISDELGRITADRAAACTGKTALNERFDPYRKGILRARDLTAEERADMINSFPEYGEVICPCMDVTKAEIMQAAERGAYDFESVKRRTGAGFGRCQGSRCRKRITDILADGSERR